MKINKEKLEALCAMPDEELWREIKKIAETYGLKLPDKTPSKEEMQKMRNTVCGTRINFAEAIKLINSYKGGGR